MAIRNTVLRNKTGARATADAAISGPSVDNRRRQGAVAIVSKPRKEFSAAVKRAAWERSGGRCEGWATTDLMHHFGRSIGIRLCNAVVRKGKCAFDHRIPVWTCDDASLANCQVLCLPCHKAKTAQDVKAIAKSKRIIRGKRKSKRGFRFWRRFNGEIVYAR